MILFALGPIGWIIKSLGLIDKWVNKKRNNISLNNIEFPDYTQKPDAKINNTSVPIIKKQDNAFGVIEIKSTIDNNTMFPFSSSVNLLEQHNLTLRTSM